MRRLSRARVFVAFTVSYCAVFGGLFAWFYAFTRDAAIERLRGDLRAVATGAVQGLDARELMALYEGGARGSDGFSADPRYRHELDWFATVHDLDPHVWPYTFVRGNRAGTRRAGDEVPDTEFVYVTDLAARLAPDKAARFLEPDAGSPAALEAWATGKLVERPGVYDDKWGSWMTDYAPVRDAHGEVVAILGVDYDAAYVRDVESSVLRQMLLIFGVAYVLVTATAFALYRARNLRTLFGRYASLALLRDVALLELGYASRRRVTVLFVDINDFSSRCETHSADEVIHMLNTFFATASEVFVASGGWIKQFVGDEILVIYNAPDDHARPERAAVEAALALVDVLAVRAAEAAAAGVPGFFDVKIGIHSGDVIVGNVGSKHRTEYAAVGDDVNLGSRIMGMSKDLGSPVLVSAVTTAAVADMPGVVFEDRGLHAVKGRLARVQVFSARRA